MSDENKFQTELVLKKINKIKAFKEKVLHIKEEEFKNYSNIKIIKEKKDKSRNKKNKSHRKNRHKTLTKENVSDLDEKKKDNNKEKSSKKENNLKKTHLSLNKDNKDERNSRYMNNSNSNNNNNNKNNDNNNTKSVVIKSIKKIEIDSLMSPKSNNKDTERKTKNENSPLPIEKEKEKEEEKEKEKENVTKIDKKEIESESFRNKGLSISLKKINNKIKEEKEGEEEKNNNNTGLEIINVEKKNCSSSPSPEKKKSKNNNKDKFKPKVKEYKLQYCVYPGNNFKLIDKAMEHRNKDWEKVPTTYSEFCDLVWAPLTFNINFQNCDTKHQYVNHIEFNNEISNKMRLYANLLHHCEKKNIDMFSIFPFTICLQVSHRSFSEQLYSFEKLYNHINDYTPKGNKKFIELFNVNLSPKIGSVQNINIPETFNNGKNLWIIKPVNLNRGRYITVEKNLHNIIKKLEEIQSRKKLYDDKKKDVKCEYLIIQKYLEKPLLYQGRKFDIRLWVLFIAEKSDEVYVFKQGHLKATCTQYNPDSDDLFVHLTNYSVQKYNANFSKIEIGNEIPFKSFQNELDKNKTGKNFYKDIYPKIIRIVRLTGGAAKKKINLLSRKYCFEIFGYDFILDENFQPYLLEINTNPGLEISSPLIEELLPRMVDDALKLTIDKEFTKSYKYADEESTFPVTDYSNKENMWERFTIL